jgi:NAD(P)-dependent dehydrogenase (short-subunit alcohol dehydrogenase family)
VTRTSLSGRTALVTGASSGIGLAGARALAVDGATVVIMGRGAEALSKARAELRGTGARIEMFVGDACQEEDVKAALAFAHGLSGRLDIVVPAVGGPTFKPLLMREVEDVRRELDLNFTSAFIIVRHGVPLMRRGGAIVCVSTAGVTQSYWGLAIYSAAKSALERFVRAAAFELGGAGIRINAVRPGATLSPALAARPEMAAMVKFCEAETPMGRVGEPDDIGRVVRFLAGDDAGWVTGQTFSVDGGQDQGKGFDLMDENFGKQIMDRVRAGKPGG